MTPKSKFITFVLSFLVPGAGHFYLGLNKRGLLFMIGFFGCIAFSWPLFFIFPFAIAVIWFYALFDSLQQATAINLWINAHPQSSMPFVASPESVERPLDEGPFHISLSGNRTWDVMWLGVALIAVGVLVLLRILFPGWWTVFANSHTGGILLALLMIGFGVWIVIRQYRQH